jgi:molybdopterin-guanine dinucleotide biosynthesis protein A
LSETNLVGAVGVGILAGGRGKRMGMIDKAMLRLGGRSFLERAVDEFARSGRELLISVGDRKVPYRLPFRQIEDRAKDRGAMGGILSLLGACESERLFIVPCDMPLLNRDLMKYVCDNAAATDDAVIFRDGRGRAQPACGLYAKTAAKAFSRLAEGGNCSLKDALSHLRARILPLSESPFEDAILTNINTPDAYENLLARFREAGHFGG